MIGRTLAFDEAFHEACMPTRVSGAFSTTTTSSAERVNARGKVARGRQAGKQLGGKVQLQAVRACSE